MSQLPLFSYYPYWTKTIKAYGIGEIARKMNNFRKSFILYGTRSNEIHWDGLLWRGIVTENSHQTVLSYYHPSTENSHSSSNIPSHTSYEEVYRIIYFSSNPTNHLSVHYLCSRGIVSEENFVTLFSHYFPRTKRMAAYVKTRVACKMNHSIQWFLLYGTRPITCTRVFLLKADSNWRETSHSLQLLPPLQPNNDSLSDESRRM